jgi:phosphoserine phosphatase RsbU/P
VVATSPRRDHFHAERAYPGSTKDTVNILLHLQKSAQKISSKLDLEELLEEVVAQVCEVFGCLETCVLLRDGDSKNLVMRATRGCSIHLKGSVFPEDHGLVSYAAQSGETIYTPDVSREPRYVRCEEDSQSELDIPLKANEKVIGVFSIAHPDVNGFSRQERQLLEAMAGHISIAIDNATRFQRERFERERMRIEQEEGRRIQESMLPKQNPVVPGYAIEGRSIPSGAVGGDFFDYIPMSDGRLALVLADVSGKGLPAALLMATTRGVLRSLARQSANASDILSQLNTMLIEDFPAEKFVTMVVAVLNPATGTVRVANAGHPFPLLVSNGVACFHASECGLPLGIMESAYCETEIALQPEDALVLYSDGISERTNLAGDEYGLERLCEIASCRDVSCETIFADTAQFGGRAPQNDDSTVIVLRRR